MKTDFEYFQLALDEWCKQNKMDSLMPICARTLNDIMKRAMSFKAKDAEKVTA